MLEEFYFSYMYAYKKAVCDSNSHAGGMAVARPYGFEIDFLRNPFSGSAVWFFVIILKFILTPIFEIKIHVEKFLDTKKISFSKSDFHNKHRFSWITSRFAWANLPSCRQYTMYLTTPAWEFKKWKILIIDKPVQ